MTFDETVESVIDRLIGANQYDACDRIFRKLTIKRVVGISSLFFLLDGYCIMQITGGKIFIEPRIWDYVKANPIKSGPANAYASFDGAVEAIKEAVKSNFGIHTLVGGDITEVTFNHPTIGSGRFFANSSIALNEFHGSQNQIWQ